MPDEDDDDGDEDDVGEAEDDDDDDEDFLGPEITMPGCDGRDDDDDGDFGVSGSVNPSHCPTRAIICCCGLKGGWGGKGSEVGMNGERGGEQGG